jgi:hypothetical protein
MPSSSIFVGKRHHPTVDIFNAIIPLWPVSELS